MTNECVCVWTWWLGGSWAGPRYQRRGAQASNAVHDWTDSCTCWPGWRPWWLHGTWGAFMLVFIYWLLRPGRRCGVLWSACLSVCLCVCLQAYLWNRWTDLHKILCADPLWLWLGPPLAALHYVMYFRFYGWRHVWPQWTGRRNVEAAPCSDSHERLGHIGAESNVYECLVSATAWKTVVLLAT